MMSTYRTLSFQDLLDADSIAPRSSRPWEGTPPRVWYEGVKDDQNTRDAVRNYAWSLAAELMNNKILSQFHQNCNYYMQIWAGMTEPTLQNLAKRRINYARLGINTRHNQLAANPLEIYYVSDKPTEYHDLAVAVNRLMKWNSVKTNYPQFRSWVEIAAPIFGIVAGLFYPDVSWKTGKAIPGMWQKVDPRMMFFNPTEEYPTVLMLRHIESGRIVDERHRKFLNKRKMPYFPRGTHLFQNFGGKTPSATRQALLMTSPNDVEVLRFWVRDERMIKEPVYYEDTQEAMMAQMMAEAETEPILTMGALPASGENHYNHLLVHVAVEKDESANWDDIQKQFMSNHKDFHVQMLKKKDQVPDEMVTVPMFGGGWRYMKFIGGELTNDGSSGLEGEPFPVAFFRNGINPEAPLCPPSDMEDLIPIQRDINEFVHNWIVSARRATFPPEFWPQEMGDPEKYPRGPGVRIQVPSSVGRDRLPQFPTLPTYPADAKEALYFLINAMQQLSASPPVTRGEGSSQRSSGREQSILMQQAEKEYTVTQDYFTWGHCDAARIILAQIKQFGDERIIIPAMGDYAREFEILKSDIDLDAVLEVKRISGLRDILAENDEKVLQLGLFYVKNLGFPSDVIVNIIAKQFDTDMAARFANEIVVEMAKMRQEAEAAQRAQMGGGQPGQGQPGMGAGPNPMNDIAMDQGMVNSLAGNMR